MDINKCIAESISAKSCAMSASKMELDLFCEIMGYPKSKVNYFIGDDPHGMVDIMEGYRYFNMTDIHVVISEYEHWMEIYKTNEELRKAVDAWYYYCQEWYEKHSYEARWVSVEDRLPEVEKPVVANLFIYTRKEELVEQPYVTAILNNGGAWSTRDGYLYNRLEKVGDPLNHERPYVIKKWKPIITPEQEAERSKGCPNLRSWLAGCPVPGLREATERYEAEQAKSLEESHKRTKERKKHSINVSQKRKESSMKKIMFNEPYGLQQATFDGSKTMTRRIVPDVILNYVPIYQQQYYEQTLSTISVEDAIMNMVGPEKMFQRYVYQVGEIVAIAQRYSQIISAITPRFAPHAKDWMRSEKGWDNKMFVKAEWMPHHIEIKSRRLEHLQDISDEDCLKEGVLASDKYAMPYGIQTPKGVFFYYSTPREAFAALIDKVSGKGTWDSNPLVWVYEFKLID